MTPQECTLQGIMAAATDPNRIHIDQLLTALQSAGQQFNSYSQHFADKFKNLPECNNLTPASLGSLRTSWTAEEYCRVYNHVTISIQNRCLFMLDGNRSRKFVIDLGKIRTNFSLKDRDNKYSLKTMGYSSIEKLFKIHYHQHCDYGKVIVDYVTAVCQEFTDTKIKDTTHFKFLIAMLQVELVYLLRQSYMVMNDIQSY